MVNVTEVLKGLLSKSIEHSGELDGKMEQWELLWENASPTSAFAAQTVSLDLSDYNIVLVIVRSWVADTQYYDVSQITKVGAPGSIELVLNIYTDGAIKYFLGRKYTASTTGVTFEIGRSVQVGHNASINNSNYTTPYQIYGIKNATKEV